MARGAGTMESSDGGSGKNPGVRVGIDIGGTFTDLVLCLPDHTLFVNKTSTTQNDPAEGVVRGLEAVLARSGKTASDVVEIVHGTTVGSNTILQKSGARTGLLATKGFRDILEIGRIRTPTMFDLAWEKPEPLVPRRWRLEIDERMGADGAVVRALDADSVARAGATFLAEGVESVAIAFINSYVNAAHEDEAARILAARHPGLLVTTSSGVLAEIKEYERTSTTVVNAYLLPAMQAYLRRLADRLAAMGVRAPLLVMASNGGMIGARHAAGKPVFAVASGPAGGVVGAARLGLARGHGDAIAFDMGGTTAKAAVILDGEPGLTTEVEFRDGISSPSRFIKGGGYMLKVPSIDIAEVGSGGGSIAEIDSGGLLVVGPRSAGADPGPACYGRGNDRPTVTDANMALGYLNPEALAGGSLKVEPKLSQSAVEARIARPLGLSVAEAAHGIREIVNVNMARAIRAVTIERGRDPRDMTLVAFGGSGPLHAVDVARLLGIRRVVVPAAPGVFCAVGMLAADVEHSFVRALLKRLDRVEPEVVRAAAEQLADEGRAALDAEGYGPARSQLVFLAEMRYLGQSSDLAVVADPARLDAKPGLLALAEDFHRAYRRTFGYANDEPVELVNLRLLARGRQARPLDFARISLDPAALDGARGTRHVSFARDRGFVEARVLPRAELGAAPIAGPAIVESYDSTIAVPPGTHAARDASDCVTIEINARG